jgi:hypothetical protein
LSNKVIKTIYDNIKTKLLDSQSEGLLHYVKYIYGGQADRIYEQKDCPAIHMIIKNGSLQKVNINQIDATVAIEIIILNKIASQEDKYFDSEGKGIVNDITNVLNVLFDDYNMGLDCAKVPEINWSIEEVEDDFMRAIIPLSQESLNFIPGNF